MTNTKRTTCEPVKAGLRRSASRLVELLDMDAPDIILSNEIGILFRKGLAGLGHDLLRSTFGGMIDLSRHQFGLCVLCDRKTSVSKGDGYYCEEHSKEIDKEREYDDYIEILKLPSTN